MYVHVLYRQCVYVRLGRGTAQGCEGDRRGQLEENKRER